MRGRCEVHQCKRAPRVLFWQPGPIPHNCTGSKKQPYGSQLPSCPVQDLGLLLPPLPKQVGLVAAWFGPPTQLPVFRGVSPDEQEQCEQLGCPGWGPCWWEDAGQQAVCQCSVPRACRARDQSKENLVEICSCE